MRTHADAFSLRLPNAVRPFTHDSLVRDTGLGQRYRLRSACGTYCTGLSPLMNRISQTMTSTTATSPMQRPDAQTSSLIAGRSEITNDDIAQSATHPRQTSSQYIGEIATRPRRRIDAALAAKPNAGSTIEVARQARIAARLSGLTSHNPIAWVLAPIKGIITAGRRADAPIPSERIHERRTTELSPLAGCSPGEA